MGIALWVLFNLIANADALPECKGDKIYYYDKIEGSKLDASQFLSGIAVFGYNKYTQEYIGIKIKNKSLIKQNVVTGKTTTEPLSDPDKLISSKDKEQYLVFISPNKVVLTSEGKIVLAEYPSLKLINRIESKEITDNISQITDAGLAYFTNYKYEKSYTVNIYTGEIKSIKFNMLALANGEFFKPTNKKKFKTNPTNSDIGLSIVTIYTADEVEETFLPNGDRLPMGYELFDDLNGLAFNDSDAIVKLKLVCLEKKINVPALDEVCNCNWQQKQPGKAMKAIDALAIGLTCQADYDKDLWPTKDTNTLDGIYSNLMRMQKSISVEKDLPLIIGLISHKYDQAFPSEFRAILQNLLVTNVSAYTSLLEKYPELKNLAPDSNFSPCRSKKENKEVTKAVLRFIEKEAMSDAGRSTSYWDSLKLFSEYLASLSDRQKTIYNRTVYNSLTKAALAKDFENTFYSQILQFTKQYSSKYFGLNSKSITDLAVFEDNVNSQSINIYPLSTDPIDDKDAITNFGFYTKKIKLPNTEQKTLTQDWSTNGKNYHASIELNKLPFKNLIQPRTSPDYSGITKDGKLSGMVMLSSNLSTSTPRLLKSYMAYYTEKGYSFSDPIEQNTKDLLQSQIGSGNLDYIVKEAHAGGNTNDFFVGSDKVKVMTGHKQLADGTTEEIQILMPTDKISMRLQNDDIKEYFATRTKNGGGELLYINGACGSAYNAPKEIAEVASPLFVNIPSLSTATTFINDPKSARYQIYEGLLARENYSQIRERIKNTPRHKDKKQNDFIFPDDGRFVSDVLFNRSDITVPQVQVFDESGKRYYLDKEIH